MACLVTKTETETKSDQRRVAPSLYQTHLHCQETTVLEQELYRLCYRVRAPPAPRHKAPPDACRPRLLNRGPAPIQIRHLIGPAHREWMCQPFPVPWQSSNRVCSGRNTPFPLGNAWARSLAPLRERGIRLATYLDNRLLLACSEQKGAVHTGIVLTHLADLGFVVNRENSVLTQI
ncbi:unnamed protein product [Pleuronectes platessa]|uniref:Uncharacterized protein n=1 Tax=Pleuronectes platessa TaxID=8262 RepID=A0A9N7ZAL3_PLEPL|nr:unnamed protein product [Pleuronectes platessa]